MENNNHQEATQDHQEFKPALDLSFTQEVVERIKGAMGEVIIGQHEIIEQLIIALLSNGHILIEGVPGVAKTLMAKTLAKIIDTPFNRIQFTPDLMPSDVIGTSIFNPSNSSFEYKKGPIFSNLVLIDEINRSPAKTQAALFEVMEERQVTFDGISHTLSEPFMVVATQNPIEHEGTYRLPEAQLDRFLFKLFVQYPDLDEEMIILMNEHQHKGKFLLEEFNPVISEQDLLQCKEQVSQVHVEEKILKYIAEVVQQTRKSRFLYLGASPRASIAILNASKAIAAMRGRDFVTPEDVSHIAMHVLNHRVIITPEVEMEGGNAVSILGDIIKQVEIPR